MEIKNHPLVIIAAYGPSEDAKVEEKDGFFNVMTILLNSISNRKEIILMGDLNGKVGQRRNDPVVRQFTRKCRKVSYTQMEKESSKCVKITNQELEMINRYT